MEESVHKINSGSNNKMRKIRDDNRIDILVNEEFMLNGKCTISIDMFDEFNSDDENENVIGTGTLILNKYVYSLDSFRTNNFMVNNPVVHYQSFATDSDDVLYYFYFNVAELSMDEEWMID